MPSFFSFEQGNESRARHTDASPLLGRYRAVPSSSAPSNRRGSLGLLTRASWRNSVHVGHGYGALLAAGLGEDGSASDSSNSSADDYEDDETRLAEEGRSKLVRWCRRTWRRRIRDVWITPKQGAVRRISAVWYSRWFVLVVMPAALAVAWCAIPFPQYPLDADDDWDGHTRLPGGGGTGSDPPRRHKTPGHGEAKVEVNFWFFVFVYYGFYNLTALMWITKVFNLYSLNWWPSTLGFPLTMALIAILGTCGPIVLYYIPEAKFLTIHNTLWISWTFCIMAMPVIIASFILLTKERHMGLRHSLSETQRIFTSSWWAGDDDVNDFSGGRGGGRAGNKRRRNDPYHHHHHPQFWHDAARDGANTLGIAASDQLPPSRVPVRLRHRFFPASFVRFVWFCTALIIGLLAYVIGEAYAEVYLRTLPHNSLDTIVYVYGWILTVFLLDALTGWILGGNQGERVGSYPLSWVFKLYFMLTYQTYVRALYARLRSPQQFILLQILSSSGLIILTPILLSAPFHWFLTVLGINGQSYAAYQKLGVRNVFIRFLAENASMVCFLGSVVVLHFGPNRDVYPYFSFNEEDPARTGDPYDYTFELTFYASAVTWACELVASCIVAGLIRWIYGVNVVAEGALDLAVWPELLPTSVVVMLHVLQNMLFSIVRLQFR